MANSIGVGVGIGGRRGVSTKCQRTHRHRHLSLLLVEGYKWYCIFSFSSVNLELIVKCQVNGNKRRSWWCGFRFLRRSSCASDYAVLLCHLNMLGNVYWYGLYKK